MITSVSFVCSRLDSRKTVKKKVPCKLKTKISLVVVTPRHEFLSYMEREKIYLFSTWIHNNTIYVFCVSRIGKACLRCIAGYLHPLARFTRKFR